MTQPLFVQSYILQRRKNPLEGDKNSEKRPLRGDIRGFVGMHRIESQCYHRVSGVWSLAFGEARVAAAAIGSPVKHPTFSAA